MEALDFFNILANGQDSKHQFKLNMANPDALAADLVAFSNANGGKIITGVTETGVIKGLSLEDIQRLNQMIFHAASQKVQPPINPLTQNLRTESGLVLIIHIAAGINKPYQDNQGVFWIKSGADKRKATSREEIQRLFQTSGLIHADELPAKPLTVADLDLDYFQSFCQRRYGDLPNSPDLPLPQLIQNMNLGRDGFLNLAGALLFAKNPSAHLPVFIVKAGCFAGTQITTEHYIDSRDIKGKMADIFQQTLSFLLANLRHLQGDQTVNSLGQPEIPRIALEEIVANALVHRNYFTSDTIKVFVFEDRVEVISPGHLPNNLTVANIKAGNSNTRNPVLASFANQILPYRGYGSGILRAMQAYPAISFIDDREKNQFQVIFKRQPASV